MFFARKRKQSASKFSTRRMLSFEQLESRTLMAGNITANLFAGHLSLIGDALANKVQIVSDGANIVLTGSGTTINGGKSPVSFSVADVTSIDVSLEAGNDKVSVTAANGSGLGFDLSGDLTIETGSGNDQVSVLAKNADGRGINAAELVIDTGDGNDKVEISDNSGEDGGVILTGFLWVSTGIGNDQVKLSSTHKDPAGNGTNGIEANDFVIDTSDGNDKVELLANNAGGNAFRVLDTLNIDTGEGNDNVTLTAKGGGGNGFLVNKIDVFTSAGNDQVSLKAANAAGTGFNIQGSLLISTAAGNDKVSVTKENAGTFENLTDPFVTFDGGDDFDCLVNPLFPGASITGFENIKP